MLGRPGKSPSNGPGTMTPSAPQDDPSGSEHAVADVLRQMLAEERARSDQLPEAMTAWQLRARSAEERLVALSGASPTSSQATPPWSASAPAAPPSDRHGERDRTTAALPPAPHRDPVFVRHPLYRGRRYRQLVEDFANAAKGVQRQYSAFWSY
jgi:hypothetical protein